MHNVETAWPAVTHRPGTPEWKVQQALSSIPNCGGKMAMPALQRRPRRTTTKECNSCANRNQVSKHLGILKKYSLQKGKVPCGAQGGQKSRKTRLYRKTRKTYYSRRKLPEPLTLGQQPQSKIIEDDEVPGIRCECSSFTSRTPPLLGCADIR